MENDRGLFSIYGAIDVNENPNYIRVRDLSTHFLADSSVKLDAVVTFEDLEMGTTRELRDTVVNFSGNFTHNFILEEELKPGRRYRVVVERPSDRAFVASVATTPGITGVVVEPSVDVPCERQIRFTFKSVPFPERVRMEVGFFHDNQFHRNEIGLVANLERREDSDEMEVFMSPRNLLVEVFTPELEGPDGRPIPPRLLRPTVSCDQLDSKTVQIRYVHFGPEWHEWQPLSDIDLGNVENGLGFFGGILRDSFTFTIQETGE